MTLEGRIDADASADRVAFAVSVRNAGEEPIELQFADAQRIEVTVYDGGDEAWRYGADRMFAQMLSTETLDPGESLSVECAWESPSGGRYEAAGSLAATGTDWSARAEFSVPRE